MSHHFAKPENALRKANDLVKVGQDNAALQILHSMLLTRRYRTWQPTHEQIMLLYIRLAVDNNKNAKDGLLQYRIICQAAQTDSLQMIIRKFCELAEARTTAALEAAKVAVAEEPGAPEPDEQYDDDVGFLMKHQHFFVHGVGGDDESDCTKHPLVSGALRYLWDAYRSVLDVMRNNANLDSLYHEVVQKALVYCTTHGRTNEFRRLCEIQRMHMRAINTHQSQTNAVDLSQPQAIQDYLKTRFRQLETASKLDLWQEAYRIIEDIDDLLNRTDTGLDKTLLSTYYSNLDMVFWKSDNALFHSYCVDKLLQFAIDTNEPSEQRQHLADRLVLSALAIPVRANTGSQRIAYLDSEDQKNMHLASMLGFDGAPSRARMLHRIKRNNILELASEGVQKLFVVFTSSFAPRRLSSLAVPLLDALSEKLAMYAPKLIDQMVLLVLEQLGRVYRVLSLDAFMRLLPQGLDATVVERKVVLQAFQRQMRLRIDHTKREIVFDQSVMDGDSVRQQLARLSERLSGLLPRFQPPQQREKELQRQQVFSFVQSGMDHEHRDVFVRKHVIERRKQDLERQSQRANELEQRRLAEEKLQRAEEERKRLADERERRERERVERLEREAKIEANKALVLKLKEKTEESSMRSRKIVEQLEDNLENIDKQKLLEAENEVENEERRVKERLQRDELKRRMFVERAMRLEQHPLLVKAHERQRVIDQAYYEEQWQQHLHKHRVAHEHHLAEKRRVALLASDAEHFFSKVMQRRQEEFNERKAVQDERQRQREQQRLAELQRRQEEEEERERQRREQEQRLERERLEQEQRERDAAEKRAAAEAAERERLEQLDRIAEKQRQRELEIEQRRRLGRVSAGASAPPPPSATTASTDGPWRRKTPVATAAAAADSTSRWGPSSSSTSSSAAAASSGGVYRPPSQRGGAATSSGGGGGVERDSWRNRPATTATTRERPIFVHRSRDTPTSGSAAAPPERPRWTNDNDDKKTTTRTDDAADDGFTAVSSNRRRRRF